MRSRTLIVLRSLLGMGLGGLRRLIRRWDEWTSRRERSLSPGSFLAQIS
jgi:hypothetical protein